MFEQLRDMWRRQGAAARAAFMLGVLLIVAAAVWFASGALRRDDRVLFSGLDPQDAATIVAELDKLKVPYRLGADETTILVDASQVHATRLKLMGKGVSLRGGVGFEIFNSTDFGMTEFAQKINYQRALQGELARTIMALDAVKSARVLLVLPDSGLFRRAGQKPKASIALALREGRALDAEQVLGIQRLVAASVPQIDAAAVTVLDQRGIALSRNVDPDGEDAAVGLGGKHELEAYLARKVVAVLDKAFGPGSAIVSVDVTLNHDQVRTTREDVSPGNASARAVLRSRTSVQPSAAVGLQAAGPLEQGGPIGPAPVRGVAAATVSEFEYQNSRVVEQTVSKPGSVHRINVGVMLPRMPSADRLKELSQVLSMAAGLNSKRGDEIAISSLDQFAPAGQAPAVKARPPADAVIDEVAPLPAPAARRWPDIATPAVVAGLLAAALLVALFTLGRARRQARAPHLTAAERERLLAQMRQWLDASRG